MQNSCALRFIVVLSFRNSLVHKYDREIARTVLCIKHLNCQFCSRFLLSLLCSINLISETKLRFKKDQKLNKSLSAIKLKDLTNINAMADQQTN